MSKPSLQVLGDVYRFSWPEDEIVIDIERIHEAQRELKADIIIRSHRQPNPGLLHDARVNLSSSSAQRTLARALTEMESGLDWQVIITQVAYLAKERWREGDALIDLDTVSPPTETRWLLEPYVTFGGPTVFFADGGTGKSLLALAIARSASCGKTIIPGTTPPSTPVPVAYLDWETDAPTHRERMNAICAGAGCEQCAKQPIFYRRQTVSLQECADNLRKRFAELGVGLVVVDSLGAARGGDPNSAEITIQIFNALRSFGVPVLIVDHVTKAEGSDSTKPYGSGYSHNLARSTWGITKSQEQGEQQTIIALTNHKSNNGRLLPRRGYEIHFVTSQTDELLMVGFQACDVRAVGGLSRGLPVKDQIIGMLTVNRAPMTAQALADALIAEGIEVTRDTARMTLNRYRNRLFVERDGKWGLLAREAYQ